MKTYQLREILQPLRNAYEKETEKIERVKDERERYFEMRTFCGSKILIRA
jgi:hypothetical protein